MLINLVAVLSDGFSVQLWMRALANPGQIGILAFVSLAAPAYKDHLGELVLGAQVVAIAGALITSAS